MKYFASIAVVFSLVLLADITVGQFTCPCGPGCLDTTCYCTLGCTRCSPEYCTLFYRAMSICVRDCGRGKHCVSAAGRRFCTNDRG